jgi:HlyD family secretion protein
VNRPEDTSAPPTAVDAEVAAVVGAGRTRPARGRMRLWLLLAAVLVAALLLTGWLLGTHSSATPAFVTAAVARGDLDVHVTATGNLQPTNQVEVGSEVSGTVESVLVDVNDAVTRGQVLARLDTSRLRDQLAQSRAALESARAQVAQATATVRETRLQYERLKRMASLSGGAVPSKLDLDTAQAALQRAQASLAGARAGVDQARAAVSSNETSLAKATIRSPIDGVVLARSVEPGQTVAASLQAPVLFTLAEDLRQMELQVDVDEADVAQVVHARRASFSVDAWPGREFPATVQRVSYGSQTKDGVVSYLTVLTVDNADLSLRPGMTATAEISVAERRDVLLVPNAALRFTPAATTANASGGNLLNRLMPHPPRARSARGNATRGPQQRVWVLRQDRPVAVPITTGASDGRFTEVTGGELKAGTRVITEAAGASQR